MSRTTKAFIFGAAALSALLSGCGLFPTRPLSSLPDEQAARAQLTRRCEEDGGIHVMEKYSQPSERIVFRPSLLAASKYPGAKEPLGVVNDRFEVWQTVRWEAAAPLRLRRTETVLSEPASGKTLARSVNYRLVRDMPSTEDAQCGDTTLNGLAIAVFRD